MTESGSSQGLFLMSSQEVFPHQEWSECTNWFTTSQKVERRGQLALKKNHIYEKLQKNTLEQGVKIKIL